MIAVGGPADGANVGKRSQYAYLDETGVHRNGPIGSAGLYKLSEDEYVFIGYTTRKCNCGAFVEFFLSPNCPLCGASFGGGMSEPSPEPDGPGGS